MSSRLTNPPTKPTTMTGVVVTVSGALTGRGESPRVVAGMRQRINETLRIEARIPLLTI
jgi:hypothetical protein